MANFWDSLGGMSIQLSQRIFFLFTEMDRADPALVQVVKELGHLANDSVSNLRIESVSDDGWKIGKFAGGFEYIKYDYDDDE